MLKACLSLLAIHLLKKNKCRSLNLKVDQVGKTSRQANFSSLPTNQKVQFQEVIQISIRMLNKI